MKRRLMALVFACLFAVSVMAGDPEAPPLDDPQPPVTTAVFDVLLSLLIETLPG